MNMNIFIVALLTFYCSCLVDSNKAQIDAAMFRDLSQCDPSQIYQYNEIININILRTEYFRSVGSASQNLPLEVAIITLGLDVTKLTASEAIAVSANIISDVSIQILKIVGVTKDELASSQFTVNEFYQSVDGVYKLVGYTVSQTLVITTAQYNQVGLIVQKAIEKGMNRIDNISFDAKPATKKDIEKNIISLAIADATTKAVKVLDQVGYTKKSIKSVYVYDAYTQDGLSLELIDWKVVSGDLQYQIASLKTKAELQFVIVPK